MKLIIAFSLILAITALIVPQTKQWFAFRTGQQVIDPASLQEQFDTTGRLAEYERQTVQVPPRLPGQDVLATVLGEQTGDKRIEIDLTNQRLYAFEGDTKVYDFPVSTGKASTPTPTGEFKIWIKLRYVHMKGGSKARGDYYNLPNVPYVMFIANDKVPKWQGYAVHGAYWHWKFGQPISHGCINLKPQDAMQLYYWATPNLNGKSSVKATDDNQGTRVIIYGNTPGS